MLKRWAMTLAVLALLLPAIGLAQETDKKAPQEERTSGFYKLDIVMREMEDGKTVNTRNYMLMLRGDESGQLRVGSRVPIGKEAQIQYFDVGLKMDCQVRERGGDAFLWARIELSNIATDASTPAPVAPVVRQISSAVQTQLVMGKPIVMTSLDDVVTKRRFVFEVTANRQLVK